MSKSSLIWKINKLELESLVARSKHFTEILAFFGLVNKGGNHQTLKKRLREDGISFEHILNNKKLPRGGASAKSDEEVFRESSTYGRAHLKRRILKQGLLENKCSLCGLLPEWQGKPLVLVLDHINGVSTDNRIQNLRLVCPNCNSQLDTFAGKKSRKKPGVCSAPIRYQKGVCSICAAPVYSSSRINKCVKCANFFRRKTRRPFEQELIDILLDSNFLQMGKKFGVSDNAVRKWFKQYHFDWKEIRDDPFAMLDWSDF